MCGRTTHAGGACYVVILTDGTKAALPIWMTEASAARGAEIGEVGEVGVASPAALQELRRLVDEVREAWARSDASVSEPPASGDTP